MTTMERQLAEEMSYLIGNNKEPKIVKRKYEDYKFWIENMQRSDIPTSKLLQVLVEKIYKEYTNEKN